MSVYLYIYLFIYLSIYLSTLGRAPLLPGPAEVLRQTTLQVQELELRDHVAPVQQRRTNHTAELVNKG